MSETIILIPSYEPDFRLIELLKELKKNSLKVIVVNDGSNKSYDNIFKVASKYCYLINHEYNKGKGSALKTGMKYIYENFKYEYVIVTMDSDGQHKVSDALKLAKYACNNTDKLVLGKRLRSNKTPLRSRLGNNITRFFYRISTGLDVYDTQTGLRAFSSKLISYMLNIEGERFEYEMNILLKCSKDKIKIKEIKIETIYIDNNSHSHFNVIKDSILVYKQIFKFLSSSFICFLIDYFIYFLFIIITDKLFLSNIVARIISGTINFNINKKIVFKNNKREYKQVLKYILLVILILILNTILLSWLVNKLNINVFYSKIIVELFLFVISWFIQNKIVFYKSDKYNKKEK